MIDSGVVKVWDTRISNEAVKTWKLHEDYVSGMSYHPDQHMLLSVGGDATLCAYDIRSGNHHNRSDDQEAELQCITTIKSGRKVICGTQEGALLVFSWGKWGDCTDRFTGHPEGVDCMLKIDESTIITGSNDGIIRIVQIQPNKILGVIGDQDEFPVEGLKCSCDQQILASYSHDEIVRFYDLSILTDNEINDDQDGDDEEDNEAMSMDEDDHQMTQMIEDIDLHDADDDDDDSSDDEIEKPMQRRIKSVTEKFFDGL